MECEDKILRGRKITGLPVIARDDGCTLGFVRELLYAQSGQQVRAILLEESTWLKGARLILWENLLNLNKQGITVSGKEVMLDCTGKEPLNELCNSRTGLCGISLLSSAGEELGTIDDILLEPGTGNVVGCELSQGITEDLLEGRKEIVLPPDLNQVEGTILVPEEEIQIIQPDTD